MNDNPSPESLHPRALAHLGDGVYELHVREQALRLCSNKADDLHRFSTSRANATFQVQLLKLLEPHLTPQEQDIVRRGRNAAVSVGRRSNQALHRQATAFEALIGYLYLQSPARLTAIWQHLDPFIQDPGRSETAEGPESPPNPEPG
jgi:ribonuclease-3 family protein